MVREVRCGVLGLLLAGCAALQQPQPAAPDPAVCLGLFEDLDRAERFYPTYRSTAGGEDFVLNPRIDRVVRRLRNEDCTTSLGDLGGIDALAGERAGFRRVEGGGPAVSTALQVGIVTGLGAEIRAATFFSNLGYRYRSTGIEGLGRRIYVGPLRSRAAMDQAIDVARRAGFVAPYPARYTRF